jgi:hypothetical protein
MMHQPPGRLTLWVVCVLAGVGLIAQLHTLWTMARRLADLF